MKEMEGRSRDAAGEGLGISDLKSNKTERGTADERGFAQMKGAESGFRRRVEPPLAAGDRGTEFWEERLMAELAYGAGLRLMELLRLRVHHVDAERGAVARAWGQGRQGSGDGAAGGVNRAVEEACGAVAGVV